MKGTYNFVKKVADNLQEHILANSIENDSDRFGRSDISYIYIGVFAPDFL